ncbi:MAG: hypothetical protein V4726_10855 [Verrucomicrobiota bacterium]
MSTLVLQLDDHLVNRLTRAAARSHKALPEWAAAELARLADDAAIDPPVPVDESPDSERMRAALGSLGGIWKERGTTDDLMNLTRGGD